MKRIIISSCLLLLALILFSQCRDKEDPIINDPIGENPPRPPKGLINTSIFGQVIDEFENPMAGVRVNAGGRIANTDNNGYYFLTDVRLDGDRAYVVFDKAGYFDGFRVFEAYKDKLTQVPTLKMFEKKSIGTIQSSSGGKAGEPGGIQVELPGDAIEGYSGVVTVVAAYINPTAPDFMARIPGDLVAENSEGKVGTLISYGMGHIELLGSGNQKLKIAAGKKAKLTIPIPESAVPFAPATMEMWSWDEQKGIWKAEGMGVKQGSSYVGEVSHFSIWNFDIWNPFRFIPTSIRWFIMYLAGKMSPEEDPEFLDRMLEHRERGEHEVAVQVRREDSGIIVYNRTYRFPSGSNRSQGYTEYEDDMRLPEGSGSGGDLEVITYPLRSDNGPPNYPVNDKYKPIGGEVPPTETILIENDDFETDRKRIQADFTKAPKEEVKIEIPPRKKDEKIQPYIINVNGKTVDCNNNPIKQGYVKASLLGKGKLIAQATSPIFNDGRFTVEAFIKQKGPDLVDEVELSFYDTQTGRRGQNMTVKVNPGVAYMVPNPVSICLDANDPSINPNRKIFQGSISITTQAQVKAFADSAYTEVTGLLEFKGLDIKDFSGITKLTKVGGLIVDFATAENLGGLVEIEEVTGGGIIIQRCSNLRNISFPKWKTKKLNGMIIHFNPLLEKIEIPGLEEVISYFSFRGNIFLSSIVFPNLKTVNTHLTFDNLKLKNLDFLKDVTGESPGLNIWSNPELEQINGISKFTFNGLSVLKNPLLKSLQGAKTKDGNFGDVLIQENPALENFGTLPQELKSGSSIQLFRNNFKSIHFPNLESLTGGLNLQEEHVTEELKFPKLKSISGLALVNMKNLKLVDLPALETSGGMNISNLDVLENLDLPKLKTVTGQLLIYDLIKLKNLDGFNSLETVTQGFQITFFKQVEVPIKTINGFNKLTKTGFLSIQGGNLNSSQNKIESINGFKELQEVGTLNIVKMFNLKEVKGFGKLKTVTQSLTIHETELKDLDFFLSLEKISSTLDLTKNLQLDQIKGLKKLVDLNRLILNTLPKLNDLEGFEGLTALPSGLLISHTGLLNLDGLENVAGQMSSLNITSNPALQDLCGLTKLMKDDKFTGNILISSNAYNPSRTAIIEGSCKK